MIISGCLALRYYGDGRFWPLIYENNREVIGDAPNQSDSRHGSWLLPVADVGQGRTAGTRRNRASLESIPVVVFD